MKKFNVAAAVAVLLRATPAFAQMTTQATEPGTITMNDNGYHQPQMTVEGKITVFDLTRGMVILDNGMEFTLAPSFEYTSLPAIGQDVQVTYDEQGGQNVARDIEVGTTGSDGSQ